MSQENHSLLADRRELAGKKTRRLRKEGLVPAVLYGYRVEPTSLQVSAKEFESAYRKTGRTTLLDLQVESARPVKVFVQDVQRHPISHAVQHVDFHAVNLRVAVDSEVPVVLTGESPAVNNNLGVLVHGLDTVTVHALPADLPNHLEVSIEGLEEVDQAIHVSDLHATGTYQITTDPSELIAKIVHQEIEAEEEALQAEEAADGDEADADTAAGDTAE